MRSTTLHATLLGLAALLGFAGAAAAGEPPVPASACTTHCHGLESTEYAQSVHLRTLSCTDCHGGDPSADRDKERAHDVSKGFGGKIAREKIPALCGDCHADAVRMAPYALPTDQLAHYRTSFHGKALFGKGDTTVAVCTDCHGAHAILAPTDPRARTAGVHQPETCGKCHSDAALMGRHGLSADAVDRFKSGVHGKALLEERTRGAPSCSDCHGSHGAAPPGVRDVAQVCGRCHINTEEQYRKSPHHRAGDQMSCRACHTKEQGAQYQRGGCTSCHDNHAVAHPDEGMLRGNEVGHCGHCHRQPDAAVEAFQTALLEGTAKLVDTMQDTRRRIEHAKESSLFLKGEDTFLRESERALVSIRPLAHSLDREAVVDHLRDGVQRQERTVESITKATTALRDRKIVIAALVFLLLLLGALFVVKLDAVRRLS